LCAKHQLKRNYLEYQDRFAPREGVPQVDSHSDWTLLAAEEGQTYTFLKFSRRLNTCDEDEDFPINVTSTYCEHEMSS